MPILTWPSFNSLPNLEQIPQIVETTRPWGLTKKHPNRFRPRIACRRLHIKVKTDELGAARGGVQALLIPSERPDRLFTAVVDPARSKAEQRLYDQLDPTERELLCQLVVDFRLAHELAHTLFYHWDRCAGPNQEPCVLFRQSRGFGVGDDPHAGRVESFCDAMAYHLLRVPDDWLRDELLVTLAAVMDYNSWASRPARFRYI